MAELTAEIVREIVQTEVGQMRTEMTGRFDEVDRRFNAVDERLDEVDQRFGDVITMMNDGFEMVIETIDQFHDEQQDEVTGVYGRLRNHNERIARLERRTGWR